MSTTSTSRAETTVSPASDATPSQKVDEESRRVVDAPTRAFHLLFALCCTGAYLTGESESWKLPHITLGYTLVGLLGFRLVWGLVGPRPVRWSTWSGKLRGLLQAKVDARQGRFFSPSTQGVSMVAVLVGVITFAVLTITSGWITDAELTGDWMSEIHESAGNALLALVTLHVGLVVGWSLMRQRNLATPMWSGRVGGRGPDLVKHNRSWLAIVMAACVLGFWVYMFTSAQSAQATDPQPKKTTPELSRRVSPSAEPRRVVHT